MPRESDSEISEAGVPPVANCELHLHHFRFFLRFCAGACGFSGGFNLWQSAAAMDPRLRTSKEGLWVFGEDADSMPGRVLDMS